MPTINGKNATCIYREGSLTSYPLHSMVIPKTSQGPSEETRTERLELQQRNTDTQLFIINRLCKFHSPYLNTLLPIYLLNNADLLNIFGHLR